MKCAMYADDLVLCSTEEYATTVKIRLQEAINILSSWSQDWCVKINKTKSCPTLFTLSTKSKPMKLMLDDTDCNTQTVQHTLELPLTRDRPGKHTSAEQKQRQDAN